MNKIFPRYGAGVRGTVINLLGKGGEDQGINLFSFSLSCYLVGWANLSKESVPERIELECLGSSMSLTDLHNTDDKTKKVNSYKLV